MSELKSVALTNSNCENFSRQDLLDFINSKIEGCSKLQPYSKVENLCSGVAYSQIMEMLFPNCIGLRRIKTEPKFEHEFVHNLRLLQAAFAKLKYDKSVPIDRLIKGRFQDNFEFLQWFKKFYDTVHNKENLSQIANVMEKPKKVLTTKKSAKSQIPETRHLDNANESEFEELKSKIESVTEERNYYLKKADSVESLIKREMLQNMKCKKQINLCKRLLQILHSETNV